MPAQGGVCLEGVCLGGVCLGGICLRGVHLFPVNRITDRCKNMTFPQLSLRTAIISGDFLSELCLTVSHCRAGGGRFLILKSLYKLVPHRRKRRLPWQSIKIDVLNALTE